MKTRNAVVWGAEMATTNIGAKEIQACAELIAHNVFHTERANEVWESATSAIRAHEDDVCEAALYAWGRRLTKREWERVSKDAQPLVEFVLFGSPRGSFSLERRAAR